MNISSPTPTASIRQFPGYGIMYVVSFVIMANANAVLSGRLLQSLHPFTFLFWAFSITSITFLLRLKFYESSGFTKVRPTDLWALLVLNVASTLSWIGYFVALRYLEPAVVTATVCGFGPISIILLEKIVRKQDLPSHCYVAAIGAFTGTAILIWASASGLSGIRIEDSKGVLVGLLAALVGGASQSMTVISIKQLGDRGWNAERIMAHRFHLLIITAAILAFTGPGIFQISIVQVKYLSMAAVFGVMIPILLLQRGIIILEPFIVSVLLSIGPVITYILQGFDARISWSIPSAVGCCVVVVFTIYGTILSRRNRI